MSDSSVHKLLSVSSGALSAQVDVSLPPGRLLNEFGQLLRTRNGFYAFESALHVFGSGGAGVPGESLEVWNSEDGWRSAYDGMADGFFFIAEDIFGCQFAIKNDHIWTFDPETGEADALATGIEDWADQLVRNYRVLTGFTVAHSWQQLQGILQPGKRLVPKVPFVLGGEIDRDNLYAADAAEGMRVRASLAVQIRDLPDGARIHYEVVPGSIADVGRFSL